MYKFIKTVDGSFLLSSEITEVRKVKRKMCSITTRSGDHYSVSECAEALAVRLECRSGPTTAAQPGFFVVTPFRAKTPMGIGTPSGPQFVGWSAKGNVEDPGFAFDSLPILAGVNVRSDRWGLQWPDGSVSIPCLAHYPSVEDWLDWVKEPGAPRQIREALTFLSEVEARREPP